MLVGSSLRALVLRGLLYPVVGGAVGVLLLDKTFWWGAILGLVWTCVWVAPALYKRLRPPNDEHFN
jgi:hypothetical protein